MNEPDKRPDDEVLPDEFAGVKIGRAHPVLPAAAPDTTIEPPATETEPPKATTRPRLTILN